MSEDEAKKDDGKTDRDDEDDNRSDISNNNRSDKCSKKRESIRKAIPVKKKSSRMRKAANVNKECCQGIENWKKPRMTSHQRKGRDRGMKKTQYTADKG